MVSESLEPAGGGGGAVTEIRRSRPHHLLGIGFPPTPGLWQSASNAGQPLGGGGQRGPSPLHPSLPCTLLGTTQMHSATGILSRIPPDSHLTSPELDLFTSCSSQASYTCPLPFSCSPDPPLMWTHVFHSPPSMVAPMPVCSHSHGRAIHMPTYARMHACLCIPGLWSPHALAHIHQVGMLGTVPVCECRGGSTQGSLREPPLPSPCAVFADM